MFKTTLWPLIVAVFGIATSAHASAWYTGSVQYVYPQSDGSFLIGVDQRACLFGFGLAYRWSSCASGAGTEFDHGCGCPEHAGNRANGVRGQSDA
jgi:hypothetical protein